VPNVDAERKRATLRELSELTGLSTAAVSYALRGQRVSPATQERVRREAERIGFRTDPIARALRGGRTEMVGVVGGSLADHWHQEFVASLQGFLHDHGLRMVLSDAAGDPHEELALARDLVDQRVDGLIVLPIDPDATDWREVAARTPLVSVNARIAAPAGAIRFDSRRGIRQALDHLRDLGHERILVLGGGPHRIPRRAGLRRVGCRFALGAARDAARRELSGEKRPTAVFALSDTVAYGVYEACRELGLDIPGDVSVAGFDDNPVSRLLAPPLTAVGWDTTGAAHAAADMLVDAIAGDATSGDVVVAPMLAVRGSTAPPRQRANESSTLPNLPGRSR
jgi:LacI family transcriptional regulator, galactose operon repressor